MVLNKDGSVSADTNNNYFIELKKACNNNNIYFIDMTNIFMEAYKTNYILPHGFINTAVGVGHLNINGHRMIANELFKHINTMTGENSTR
jgi:hypothetical protein